MTRSEHLQWCKDRALEYIRKGDIEQGITSMMSDMGKHPEINNETNASLSLMMLMSDNLKTTYDAERFINGFN